MLIVGVDRCDILILVKLNGWIVLMMVMVINKIIFVLLFMVRLSLDISGRVFEFLVFGSMVLWSNLEIV